MSARASAESQLLDCVKVGATVQSIKTNLLFKIEVPLPPLEEQLRIVDHVRRMENKVTEIQKLQEKAEQEISEIGTSILDRAFEGML